MLPFIVSGAYVIGGGLTAGSMMALYWLCIWSFSVLLVDEHVRPDSRDKRRGLFSPETDDMNFPFP